MKPGNNKGEKIYEAAWKQAKRRWPNRKAGSDRFMLEESFKYCFMEGVRYALKKF